MAKIGLTSPPSMRHNLRRRPSNFMRSRRNPSNDPALALAVVDDILVDAEWAEPPSVPRQLADGNPDTGAAQIAA